MTKLVSNSDLFAKRGDPWTLNRRQRKKEHGVEDFPRDNLSSFLQADLMTAGQMAADAKMLEERETRNERRALAFARASMEKQRGEITTSRARRMANAILSMPVPIDSAQYEAPKQPKFFSKGKHDKKDRLAKPGR